MNNTKLLTPLVHMAMKPQPRIAARAIPKAFTRHDEFESWIAQQKAVLASILEIPESWELPLAMHHPKGYVALSSKQSINLALIVGTEIKTIPFEQLEAGQLVLMWVNHPVALAA